MKHSTQYLYDCSPSDFADLPYREALQFKHDQSMKLRHKLVEPHYSVRDETRLHAVMSATKHVEGLINELTN